jgi:hypothetical protein
MARIAIAYNRTLNRIRDCGELGFRFQPVAFRIVEFRTVNIQRAGNVAIGLGRGRFFLAQEE